jgi:hypothetical protein
MRREERSQQLWSILALAATNRQILTYDIVARLTGVVRPSIGDFLRPIQQYCEENRLPALTSIVVSDDSGLPGEGFITAQHVPAAQVRVFRHDWLQLPAPSAEQLAEAYSRAPDRRGIPSKTRGRNEYLPIILIPADRDEFKAALLKSRTAEIVTTYLNGEEKRRLWKASFLSESSNVIGNLRSRPEFRAGQWQANSITKVTVRVIDSK